MIITAVRALNTGFDMKDILNIPEVQSLVSVLLTALVAWVKRKLDLKKINTLHRKNVEEIAQDYESKIVHLRDRLQKLENDANNG